MDKVRGNIKIKVPTVKALNENVSPLNIEMDDQWLIGRGRHLQSMTMSPSFQPYAENIDVGSPLVRYFLSGSPISGPAGDAFTSPTFGSSKYRSAKAQQYSGNSSFGSRGRLSLSPLSSIENFEIAPMMSPPIYGTPVNVDDEVLVMDDILVRSTLGGKGGRSSSGSSGQSSSSSSSSSSSLSVKICRAWEESGNCRYNYKCQFAHGKEELHSTRLSIESNSEAQTYKSSMSAKPCTYGPKSRTVHQHHAAAESEYIVVTSQPTSPVKPEPDHTLANSSSINDWSPLDDGIELVLPHGSTNKAPSREEVEEYISSILYGPTAKRRLPVFAELSLGQ